MLVLGSMGEFFAMTAEQRRELTAFSVKHIAGRMKVLVGTASMDFEEAVALARHALSAGADAVAVISPYSVSYTHLGVFWSAGVRVPPLPFIPKNTAAWCRARKQSLSAYMTGCASCAPKKALTGAAGW